MPFTSDKTRQGAAGVSTGYDIDYSCRFNDDDAYLSRTPGSTTNRLLWTFSVWLKLCNATAGTKSILQAGADPMINYDGGGATSTATDRLRFNANSEETNLHSNASYRDPSAWYHVMMVWDTAQVTAANRLKAYVNGSQITFTGSAYPPVDRSSEVNTISIVHYLGINSDLNGGIDGYMAEVHFIDGSALTPSSFGETGDYGEWKPKKVSGVTYGTNGYYLDFADAAAMGNDVSGENNDWTANNIAAHDQTIDTPTNNFATFNPLYRGMPMSGDNDDHNYYKQGNLYVKPDHEQHGNLTIVPTTGKWYCEMYVHGLGSYGPYIGWMNDEVVGTTFGGVIGSWRTYFRGASAEICLQPRNDATLCICASACAVAYGGSNVDAFLAGGDILQLAWDCDTGKMWLGKDEDWISSTLAINGNPAAGTNPTYTATVAQAAQHLSPFVGSGDEYGGDEDGARVTLNCGQEGTFQGIKTAGGHSDDNDIGDFFYDVPAGFLALCTSNLPEPAVIPSEYFNAKIYTGTGAGQVVTMGLQPDILWVANREDTESYPAVNSLGGATKYMHLDATTAEATDSTIITNFTSTGFTAGGDNKTSASGDDYVAYAWGGLTSTASGTTTGSGTGQAYSAKYNTDAGMSIIDYDGNVTAGHTIPHHLGVAPDLILIKHHTTQAWNLYIKPTGEAEFGWSVQFSNNWYGSNNGYFNDTSPTSTVFTLSAATGVNRDLPSSSDNGYYAYCFKSIDGFSQFGTYKPGSASASTANFVYTGFRPKFVLTKGLLDDAGWNTWDTVRELHLDNPLSAAWGFSTTGAEEGPNTSSYVDLVSNGFKLRNNLSTGVLNRKYLYIAFAEVPFKYGNAR